ncbi:MAG: acylphosphatase, partial [Selenomonadaceae bacterium]|nr:acylphosphatase [Selenomonadaceae bacterium]
MRMTKKMRRISAAFFTIANLFLCTPYGEAKGTVDEISASVTAMAPIPALVQQRMEATVAAIGTQLLAGRRLADVEEARAQEEAIIHEVFDKVLVGYSVENVTLVTGETSRIEIRLVPWADVVRAVHVDVDVEGMPPLVEEMARRDLADVGRVFGEGMQGLPIAASDWTNGVLKRSLQDYMNEHLPEFRADFDVVPGVETRVAVTVYPRLPVVRTIDLSMRSDTIPNFTLLNHRQRMQENVNMLIGVPVAFV